jgi:hypothetical protein
VQQSRQKVAIFNFTIFGFATVSIGETPNDITLVFFNNETTFAPCDPECIPEKFCMLGLHPWQQQKFVKKVNKVIRQLKWDTMMSKR